MKIRNVISFFDGMSGGQIALTELEIVYDNYYAVEIDKFAIKQTQSVFKDTIQLGDIKKLRLYLLASQSNRDSMKTYFYTSNKTKKLIKQVEAIDINSIDLVFAGSPCQGFSFAGKQLNFQDPRSKLFFEFMKIFNRIKSINPKVKYLVENVCMQKKFQRVMNEHLGLIPVNLNSRLVSAQNRERFYWTNRVKSIGLFGELYCDIPEPVDEGIYLSDIVQPEDEIEERYYLGESIMRNLMKRGQDNKLNGIGFKAEIKTGNEKSGSLTTKSDHGAGPYLKLDKDLKVKTDQHKASCVTGGAKSGGNHSDMDVLCVALRGRLNDSSVYKQNVEATKDGKSNCLTCSPNRDNLIITYDFVLRRLTPLEFARLQTVPEWYKFIVSNSQVYKMLGNGWTIKMIMHILKIMYGI